VRDAGTEGAALSKRRGTIISRGAGLIPLPAPPRPFKSSRLCPLTCRKSRRAKRRLSRSDEITCRDARCARYRASSARKINISGKNIARTVAIMRPFRRVSRVEILESALFHEHCHVTNGWPRLRAELSVRLAATFSRREYIFHHLACTYMHYALCNV